VAKVVERQIRNWEIARAQRLEQPDVERREVQDFVAISRTVGSGGVDVAKGVAERLGWPFFDKEILAAMAGDDETRRRLYELMDERDTSWFEETARGILHGHFSNTDYAYRLTETVLSIARQGHAVFLGRGAGLILPADRGLRVRIVAPEIRSVRTLVDRHGLAPDEAVAVRERVARERRDFLQSHFKIDLADPLQHDLTVNLARYSVDQAVDLVVEAARLRGLLED
jgi:cytidylate kinase